MPMVLNKTQAMLSITCHKRVINFVPGIMQVVEKSDLDILKKHRVFAGWCDDESLVIGAKAKKGDATKEIEDTSTDGETPPTE